MAHIAKHMDVGVCNDHGIETRGALQVTSPSVGLTKPKRDDMQLVVGRWYSGEAELLVVFMVICQPRRTCNVRSRGRHMEGFIVATEHIARSATTHTPPIYDRSNRCDMVVEVVLRRDTCDAGQRMMV